MIQYAHRGTRSFTDLLRALDLIISSIDNSKLNNSGGTVNGSLTITGDLVVSGSATMSGTCIATSGKFGDMDNGDYSEFEDDGTLVFNGDATVWEDLNFDPVRSGGPVENRPDDVTINNVYYKEFTSANNQSCGDAQEIPHNAKLSATFHGHAHVFLKSGESAGTTGVTFTVYWVLSETTGTTTGSFTLTATSAQLAANAHKVDIYDSGFTGSSELGAQLALALYRTGGDAGDVIVMTYGIHYEIDQVGSKEIVSK